MTEALELELRQLEGISFVAISEQEESVTIELYADDTASKDALREDARRLARSPLDRPAVIEFCQPGRSLAGPGRVRVVVVLPWPERDELEIHLAWGHRRVSVPAPADDLAAVG